MAPSSADEFVTQVGFPVAGSTGSRLMGVVPSCAVLARVETHRSWLPQPLGRLEVRMISRPSRLRMAERVSRTGELRAGMSSAGPHRPFLLHSARSRLLHVLT